MDSVYFRVAFGLGPCLDMFVIKGNPPIHGYWWVVLAASSRPTGWPRETFTALPQGPLDPGKGPSGVVVTLVRQAFASDEPVTI